MLFDIIPGSRTRLVMWIVHSRKPLALVSSCRGFVVTLAILSSSQAEPVHFLSPNGSKNHNMACSCRKQPRERLQFLPSKTPEGPKRKAKVEKAMSYVASAASGAIGKKQQDTVKIIINSHFYKPSVYRINLKADITISQDRL